MNFIFLIVVMSSNTAIQKLIPMKSMQQCKASFQAMELVKEKRTGWNEYSPRVDSAHCIEVPR